MAAKEGAPSDADGAKDERIDTADAETVVALVGASVAVSAPLVDLRNTAAVMDAGAGRVELDEEGTGIEYRDGEAHTHQQHKASRKKRKKQNQTGSKQY